MVTSYGIIPIYTTDKEDRLYLLLQSHDGFWSFPKGHPENNETAEATAIREAHEETGIKLRKKDLGKRLEYEYEQPIKGVMQTKRIVLFPVFVSTMKVTLQAREIARHEWLPYDKIVLLKGSESLKKLLLRVEESYNKQFRSTK